MKTRVTITLDPEVHARAKRSARARRTSVSGLIESLLRAPAPGGTSRSQVDELIGSAALRTIAPGTDPLFDALHAREIVRRR